MLETIFEIAITALFILLLFKAIKLTFRITWSLTKIITVILFVVAIPTLIACFALTGGTLLLIPLGIVALAFGLVKRCVA